MLYDDHVKLGHEHAMRGLPPYRWTDPHLQEAYNRGYKRGLMHRAVEELVYSEQRVPGFPGMIKRPRY